MKLILKRKFLVKTMAVVTLMLFIILLELISKSNTLVGYVTSWVYPSKSTNVWPKEDKKYVDGSQILFRSTERLNRTKKVLAINGWPYYERKTPVREAFADCPVKNCVASTNPLGFSKADAVIFRDNVIGALQFLRPQNQIWVYFTMESPMWVLSGINSYPGLINWTATFRTDSDFEKPYGKWVYYDKNVTEYPGLLRDFTKGKTKKVAWLVSNCNARNNRLQYALELQKYIQVDIYGKCGKPKCEEPSAKNCFQYLVKDYKFYLAFENSNCKQYVTEKLFTNCLQNDILPVVMGARPEDYERVAPKNSFIHVEDFSTPEQLAKYLHELDKNDTLYNSYFKWKGTGEVVRTRFMCQLCEMLHSDPPHKSYKDLLQWWKSNNTCTHGFWRDVKN